MKKIKIVALMMVAIMLTLSMVACGSSGPKVNCKISIVINGETVLNQYAAAVEGSAEDMPTVLEAAMYAFDKCDIVYTVDDAGMSLESITVDSVEYKNGLAADGSINKWLYTANGVEPESGKAGTNLIEEGMEIVFTYTNISAAG